MSDVCDRADGCAAVEARGGRFVCGRRTGCGRGPLSLVIHGRRKSGRLERRLKAMGFAVKEAV